VSGVVLGTPAPLFSAESHSNPRFAFGSLGGRYILLGFLPSDPERRQQVLAAYEAVRRLLKSELVACLVLRRREDFAQTEDRPWERWFLDEDGEIARLYGAVDQAGDEKPRWFLVDPSLRFLLFAEAEDTAGLEARLRLLPPPERHAGTELNAPVLIVPRILEPALCRRLIALYDRSGGEPSGVMRDVNGRTVSVLDDFKRRRDATIEDPALRGALKERLAQRLLPEIRKAFQFEATRLERYIVACYDATDGGYFRAHRDDTTAGTAHRKFAVSINLNAEEFEGGDLRFPEFGPRTYRPPTGGAVVFSCTLLHEATPVTHGRRYAFLPFLYDEAGAKVRQANLHLLGESAAEAEPGTAA
jgi:predicted 2-oxoglutarate/Fe(II)-dependent dioxygenase YbiX